MNELPSILKIFAPVARLLRGCGFGGHLSRTGSAAAEAMRREIVCADLRISPEEIFCSRIAAAVVFALIGAGFGWLFAPDNQGVILGAFGFMLLTGWTLPWSQVQNAAKVRREQIVRQLPYAVDLMVSAMRAGLDFGAALRYYVNLKIGGPLPVEFAHVLRDTELGVARIPALLSMAERLGVRSVSTLVSALALGSEMGAPLSATMEVQAEEMRRDRFALAEQKAQRAPSLMLLPMALFIMPAVFVVIGVPVYIRYKASGGGM